MGGLIAQSDLFQMTVGWIKIEVEWIFKREITRYNPIDIQTLSLYVSVVQIDS